MYILRAEAVSFSFNQGFSGMQLSHGYNNIISRFYTLAVKPTRDIVSLSLSLRNRPMMLCTFHVALYVTYIEFYRVECRKGHR